jgi:hypothetical protein
MSLQAHRREGIRVDVLVDNYRRLIEQSKNPSLSLDAKLELLEEAAYLKGYVVHLRKYSDITILKNDGIYEEDYFGYVPIKVNVDTEDEYTRRARKLKKEDNKRQLLEYYKYSKTMYRKKMKYYRIMCNLYITLSKAFGRYGMNCQFKYDDTVIDSSILGRLSLSIELFTKEFEYISRARGMRSLYGSYQPSNFAGVHKLLSLTDECLDWMHVESNLEQFRNYISDQEGNFESTWCGKGIMTPQALETVLRLSLRPNKFLVRKRSTIRTLVRYRYTDDMTSYLPLPEDNDSYIDNLRVRTLIPLITRPFDFTDKFSQDDFLYEMEAIQEFADMVYEST